MIRKIATVAAVAVAALTVSVSAQAMDFPATPLNAGPPRAPGEGMIPGVREGMMIVNGVTQPILQPILVPGAQMAAGPEPMMRHRRHRHMSMHKKMKKAM